MRRRLGLGRIRGRCAGRFTAALCEMLPAKLGMNATTFPDRSNQPQIMFDGACRLVADGSHGGEGRWCQSA